MDIGRFLADEAQQRLLVFVDGSVTADPARQPFRFRFRHRFRGRARGVGSRVAGFPGISVDGAL